MTKRGKVGLIQRKVRTLRDHPRRVFAKYFLKKPVVLLYRALRPQPNFIADMSWDNLIVLDACRFDVFRRFNDIPGKLRKLYSAGTDTSEWLVNNFSHRQMKDVIYISGNPFVSYYYLHKKLGYIPFFKIVEVWKDGWSKKLNTVHPSAINKATLKSLKSDPQKRRIIHYLQPHHPFIGDVKVKERGLPASLYEFVGAKKKDLTKPTVWDMLRDGRVSIEVVWRAYVSNLQLVLRYVKELLPNLTGKICITSDHGNTFGRFGFFYQHPSNTPLPELIEVPWLEVRK